MFLTKSSLVLVVVMAAVVYGGVLEKRQRVSGGKVINAFSLVVNGTIVRDDYVDTFSCNDLGYGYYADVDNRCEVFHVCLPMSGDENTQNVFKWSFACPVGLQFDQEIVACVEPDDAILCSDSPLFFYLTEELFQEHPVEEGDLQYKGSRGKPRPVGSKRVTKYRPHLALELANEQPASLTFKGKHVK